MGRPTGCIQKTETSNHGLIPLNHDCLACGENKTKVNFWVTVNKFTTVVNCLCNGCRHKKPSGQARRRKRIIKDTRVPEPNALSVKEQIDNYFKNKN